MKDKTDKSEVRQLDYKLLLGKARPVTFDQVCVEDGKEVERMCLNDFIDGQYVEDYIKVTRTRYDIATYEDGAVYANYLDGLMLVKAPNVKFFHIPEGVLKIASLAFKECTDLQELDVPYTVGAYELHHALNICGHSVRIHVWDWPYEKNRSPELEKEIAEGVTDEYGFVYSRDGRRLLKAASVKTYFIPEGVEHIERMAFIDCKIENLHVPYTCKLDDEEYPIWGSEHVQAQVMKWDRPYAQEDEIDDMSFMKEDVWIKDKYGVAYTKSKKRLLFSDLSFNETAYHVPDGVETICSHAFRYCRQFLTLGVPSSIRVIGCSLFGDEGGRIVLRKEGTMEDV